MIPMIACNVAVLAIAMLYYTWRDSHQERSRKQVQLHERVAYMLWVAAQRSA